MPRIKHVMFRMFFEKAYQGHLSLRRHMKGIWEAYISLRSKHMLSWHGTRFQRFGTCSMFRTCSAHRVPHMFRTSRIAICTWKKPRGMPLAGKRAQISEIRQFKKLFTLLVSEKSNSQNRHIYNFHASKNPDTNVRGISSLESGERVPHMFRTFPIETEFHAN